MKVDPFAALVVVLLLLLGALLIPALKKSHREAETARTHIEVGMTVVVKESGNTGVVVRWGHYGGGFRAVCRFEKDGLYTEAWFFPSELEEAKNE